MPTLLDDTEFQLTFTDEMQDVTADPEPVVDIWPYVDSISAEDLRGFVLRKPDVERVYRTSDERIDHVLVPTHTKNVYLSVVVLRTAPSILGHHLLDLNEKYGLVQH